MSAAGELVIRCFHARTQAHVFHLKTRSFAAHTALQDFYDGIIPLVDGFAEAYQGEYGLIEEYPGTYRVASTPEAMLDELFAWTEKNRNTICDKTDTYLLNILDEISALIRSTQYKLKFLK